jgi:hypothetical protein
MFPFVCAFVRIFLLSHFLPLARPLSSHTKHFCVRVARSLLLLLRRGGPCPVVRCFLCSFARSFARPVLPFARSLTAAAGLARKRAERDGQKSQPGQPSIQRDSPSLTVFARPSSHSSVYECMSVCVCVCVC